MTNGDQAVYPNDIFDENHKGERIIIGQTGGLTKREYFAAMALQGICANHYVPHWDGAQISNYAVQYADALIKALNND